MQTVQKEPVAYSVDEAAKVLGISASFAYQLCRSGQMPGVRRLGNRILISRAELERYIDGG
jgi:excisionase family DNA binding protein